MLLEIKSQTPRAARSSWLFEDLSLTTLKSTILILVILTLALSVRLFTMQFMRAHLNDTAWFQTGTYAIFDKQAQQLVDGQASFFWIDDRSRTDLAVYPPGYSLWLALIYKLSGSRTAADVQAIQTILDVLSVALIIGVGTTCFDFRTGLCSGGLAALSPLLALYGVTPLADSPTSWLVVAGVWMLLLGIKKESAWSAMGAGLLIGASCWLRANGVLLWVWLIPALFFWGGGTRAFRSRLSISLAIGALLVIAPIMLRNCVAFRSFVPAGLGAGTNMWEGIGETKRAGEFGAVFGDDLLLEQERAEMSLGDNTPVNLYWPNGVERDRARMRKAIQVIAKHPLWYAGVMLGRIRGVLKFAGKPAPVYGSSGINITSEKTLPAHLQGGLLAFFANLLGILQSIYRYVALPLMVAGVWLAFRRDRRITWLLLTPILYYLILGSTLHTEIRYGLPMQALLIVFAGLSVSVLIERISGGSLLQTRSRV